MGGEISKLRVSFPLTSWQNPSLSFSPTHPLRLSWVTCPRCGSCDSSQSPRGTMPLGLWERCRRDRGRMNAWLIWPDWFLREIRGKLPSTVLPAGSASTCFQFCAILASAPGGFSGGRAHPPGRRRHHVPLWQRPLRPVVLLVLPPAQRERLGGVPYLPFQHIGAGAGPRPASPAAVPYRRRHRRFAAAPPPLSVGPPRLLPPLPVAAPQPEAVVAAGRNGVRRDAEPPGERARRQQQPGNRRRAAGGGRLSGLGT